MGREPNVHDHLARRFDEQKKSVIDEIERLRAELSEMDDESARSAENAGESPPDRP
jgi:hypothetical protein